MTKVKINSLRAGTLLLFTVFVLSVLLQKFTPANYKISAKDAITDTNFRRISLFELKYELNKPNNNILLAIIGTESIDSAININNILNINIEDILSSKTQKHLKSKYVMVVSSNESTSYQIAFILFQLGIKAYPVAGDVPKLNAYFNKNNPANQFAFFSNEKPKFNFALYFRGKSKNIEKNITPQKEPTPKVIVGKSGC